jgi:hypothetical protein
LNTESLASTSDRASDSRYGYSGAQYARWQGIETLWLTGTPNGDNDGSRLGDLLIFEGTGGRYYGGAQT